MALTKLILLVALMAVACSGLPARSKRAARVKRVVGGAPYHRGEYPFHVSLWYMAENNYYTAETPDRHHTCGGSLIDANWVLTSAICFDDSFLPGTSNLENWLVVVGMYNQLDALEEAQILTASEFFRVPSYSLGENYGDLALLKLSSPANLSDPNVDTVSFSQNHSVPATGEECTVIGWGQTAEEPYGNGSYVPRAAGVTTQAIPECAATYSQDNVVSMLGFVRVDSGSVCAGNFPGGGADQCDGDYGGPLLCNTGVNGTQEVVATVTTGFGCGRPGYAGVYTRVGSYGTWIAETMAANSA